MEDGFDEGHEDGCEGQGTRKGAGEGPSEVIRREGLE